MLLELSYKEFQAKLHPRKDPEEGEATAHRVKGWKKPNQPQDRNRKRNRGYRKPIGARVMEAILSERLGGKGYKPRKDYAGRRVSGDWENSDRGGGHKWKARVGKPVEKKSPTYLAYVKNKKKALNNSYEPEGEFLGEFNSNEEIVLFVESLVEEGYTEQEILLELERKGLGTAILSKTLELGLGGIKNTIKLGKQVYNLGKSSRVKVDNLIGSVRKNLEKRSSGKYIKTSSNSGSGLPTGVKKAKTSDIQVKKRVEVLPPTNNKFKGTNITPKEVSKGVDKGLKAALPSSSELLVQKKDQKKEVQPFQNRITGNGKKIVNPEKNPVVNKGDGGKADWLKKTRNSPAARSGAFTDDERWNTQLKHRAWKASRQKTKVNEEGKSVFSTPYADKLKNIEKWKLNNDKLYKKFGWTLNKAHYEPEGEMIDESIKDELLSKAAKAHKKAKNFKRWRNEAEKARQTALKPGEVRWMDKKTGKWKSNKK